MPLVDADPGPVEQLPPAAPPVPGFDATMAAAFRQGNTVVSTLQAMHDSGPFARVPGYSARDEIMKRPDLWEHASKIAASHSPAQTAAIIGQIDRDTADKKTMAASGAAGVLAGLVAGGLDPTMFMPGRVAIGVAKDGLPMIRAAAEVGGAMGLQSTVQETLLHATQPARTAGESIVNVGSATLLGALLGSAIGGLSKGEHAALVAGLDHERATMAAHAAGEPPPMRPEAPTPEALDPNRVTMVAHTEGPQAPSPAPEVPSGAPPTLRSRINETYWRLREAAPKKYPFVTIKDLHAALSDVPLADLQAELRSKPEQLFREDNKPNADTATEVQVNGNPRHKVYMEAAEPPVARAAGAAVSDERDLQLVSAGGVEKLALDAKTRGMTSPFDATRRTNADFSELPLLTEGNLRGETTAQGLPVETDWKIATREFTDGVQKDITDNWTKHRFADEKAPWFAAFRDHMNMLGRPADRLTQEEFAQQVGWAMTQGDRHEIPEVAAAAQAIRRRMEPWGERAEAAIEGFLRREGGSYFPHYWNKKLIREMRPEFANFLTAKFAADQAEKAAIQGRVRAHANSLEVQEGQIKKLTDTLERKRDALDEAEVRAEEVQRFNKFAFQRSEKLSEPLDEKAAKIRGIEAKIGPQLDKLEKLAEDIKAEKEDFPEIKEADALIFKMIGAAQKLRQSKELIDAVDAASEYVDALGPVIEGFKGGIREASAAAKMARRELGADTLVALENSRTALKKEIAPLLKELNATRKALKEERAARLPGARGGAVFETKIRERGNIISDQLSGKRAEIEDLEAKLTNEHLNAAATRARIETEIGKWEGKSTKEAKAALKARDKYEAERQAKAAAAGKPKPTERLTQADSAVDAAIKQILESQKDREIEYLRQDAQQTINHILGHPDGRLYAEGGGFTPGKRSDDLRGSEMARRLNVSNEEAWPWIEQNAEKASEQWARTFLPDTLIAEKFGDVEMRGPRQAILDEHAARSDATKDPKERLKLDNAKDRDLDDIVTKRDKMRGTLNVPADRTDVAIMRAAGVARNVNVITSMGVSGLASLADTGTVMMRHGMLHTLGDAFMPYFRSLLTGGEFHGEAMRQARAAMVAVEWQLANRHHQLAGVLDGYRPNSTAERALQWGADKMQLLNLLAPWTDFIKTMTMVVSAPDMKRAMEASLKGTATARQTRMLGEANIPAHMYERILNQYTTHGGEIGGVWLPSLDKWTDQVAKRHFQGAQIREADISVVTPGIGDTPNWFSKPLLGMFAQFKSYTAASHTRILIANLQRRDAQVLSGLVGMLGVGMMTYKLNSITGGQPTSDRPQDWIKEAMSRSNMFGWFEESNAFASKLTRGQLDMYRLTGSDHMLSKYEGRSVVDQLLGPTVGNIQRFSQVTGALASRNVTAADVHAGRRLVFLQNLVYVRGLWNEVEQGVNNAFGVPQKAEGRR